MLSFYKELNIKYRKK